MFVRLSRCNLSCGWCDRPWTWDWQRYDPRAESAWRTVEELAAWALGVPVGLVVITGGEPLLQQRQLIPLVRQLVAGGRRVEVETNGTIVPDPALLVGGVRFNVSAKLANCVVPIERRIVPAALEAFAASGRAVFKFVTRTVDELEEIAALADRFGLSPVLDGFCSMAVDPDLDTGLVAPGNKRFSPAAVAGRDFGNLTTRRTTDEKSVECGVHAFGPERPAFAETLADPLRAWAADHRGGPARASPSTRAVPLMKSCPRCPRSGSSTRSTAGSHSPGPWPHASRGPGHRAPPHE
ncbi:radical SAM protein [Streptomyces sp. SBT349]|uniref:radical SAM protein n=1 Tax=Streptomyces sp. SBT349 TaxID=1580539 RepID=UPI00069F9528|nr:radical SAM protein [Streptomyces sp. SBT349]